MVLAHRTRHQPERPSWDCRACTEPRPCPIAKVELAEHRFPRGLFLHLTSCLIDIIDDRFGQRVNAGGEHLLYDRIVSGAVPVEGGTDAVVAERSAPADGQR